MAISLDRQVDAYIATHQVSTTQADMTYRGKEHSSGDDMTEFMRKVFNLRCQMSQFASDVDRLWRERKGY